VESILGAKGFSLTSENPDFLVGVQTSRQTKVHWRKSSRYYNPDLYKYEEGMLVLDFLDAKTNELIWHATAKAELASSSSPEQRDKTVDKVVTKMLENFPPVR
jgi:hypothetical protein